MPVANSAEDFVPMVTIPLEEYRTLVMAKNTLDILLNSVGRYHNVDSDVLQTVAKTIGFELPSEE